MKLKFRALLTITLAMITGLLAMESEKESQQITSIKPHLQQRLINALVSNNIEYARKVIAQGANPSYDAEGNSIIVFLLQKQPENNNLLKLALELGADPNIKNSKDGYTPLIYAAADRNPEAVKISLENGANPNLTDNYGSTALISAIEGLRFGPNPDDLIKVRTPFSFDSITSLLKSGANPHIKDNFGKTVFSYYPQFAQQFKSFITPPPVPARTREKGYMLPLPANKGEQ